jgi:plastocyanin
MKMKQKQVILILGTLVISALFAGCTSSNYQSPQLSITQPQNGSTIQTSDVTVTVQVSNFNLVDKLGQSNVAGEGHLHYFIDVTAPTTPNQPAVTATGTYVATADTSYTWLNVPNGMHMFSVELVNNDHTPLNPAVVSTVMITVQNTSSGTSPQISITQPTAGQSLPAGNITVSVDVSNFNLVDKLGQANVTGEGHIHYFLDVTPPTAPGQPAIPPSGSTWAATANTTYVFKNVSAGSHTISVELVNNDHTPLQPPVTASITITVTNTGGGGGQTAVIYLKAHNIAFNLSTITVPAGAQVTVHFTNDDNGIPHNFAVYTSSAATTTIFKGDIITGVSSITYNFTAPATPGTYFFRCDVHPNQMNGNFIVQ